MQHVDDLPDLRHHARHQAFGRLVEQDDLRLQHHGARDGEHLLLAARQRAAGLIAPLRQDRKVGEHLVEQRPALVLGDAVAVETGAQVFHHREQPEDAAVLRHIADAEAGELVRRQAGDGVAVEQHGAVARPNEAHDGFQRRAFADAVAAEEADHLAGTDMKRNAVQDVAFAVIGVHVLDQDQRHGTFVGGAHVLR